MLTRHHVEQQERYGTAPTVGRLQSPAFVALLLALATLVVAVTLSLLRPPVARVHDEFSYLLAADTFAHGRLTNPPHPLWRHFETIHVIQQPSYASKYPPGQGIMLAVGQLAIDWPIAGVWLTSVIAVVACYWMLLGLAPAKWAALGAAILIVHPGFQLTWGQTYWGGTLAFAGGALVIGAAARLAGRSSSFRTRDAVAMATGALVLSVTRPFEGLVVCMLVAGWIVVCWTKHGWPAPGILCRRVVLPQLAVLAVGGVGLASYNQAVTGNPLVMPYQVHEQSYGMCPLFLFDTPEAARDYRHPSLLAFHAGWSMEWFDKQQTWLGLAETKCSFLYYATMVLAPFPILATVVMLPLWRGSKFRGPLTILLLAWLVTQVTVWNWPHYIAPVAPIVILAAVYGLRNLRLATRQWPCRFPAVGALFAIQTVVFAWAAAAWISESASGWQHHKLALENRLTTEPGKHLVFVEYTPQHHPHEEWVYNAADLDNSKVIWAHAMSREENAELVEYYRDREVWRLAADSPQPRLAPYRTPNTTLQLAGPADPCAVPAAH